MFEYFRRRAGFGVNKEKRGVAEVKKINLFQFSYRHFPITCDDICAILLFWKNRFSFDWKINQRVMNDGWLRLWPPNWRFYNHGNAILIDSPYRIWWRSNAINPSPSGPSQTIHYYHNSLSIFFTFLFDYYCFSIPIDNGWITETRWDMAEGDKKSCETTPLERDWQ